jgi:hypothetical protein
MALDFLFLQDSMSRWLATFHENGRGGRDEGVLESGSVLGMTAAEVTALRSPSLAGCNPFWRTGKPEGRMAVSDVACGAVVASF